MLALEAIGIDALAGCVAAALIARGRRLRLARRSLRMARHPSPTFVFADLVGYTTLTEQSGDEAAADVARKFRRAMSLLSRQHGAWHVKSMGDGAMIWVPDAGSAVRLVERTLTEVGTRPDLLPVRVGAHTGPAVMRDGDWYGSAVNVAARLADLAKPNEAVVSDATQSIAGEYARSALCCRDEVGLRGVARPVAVWRMVARRPGAQPRAATTNLAAQRASSSVRVRGSSSRSPAWTRPTTAGSPARSAAASASAPAGPGSSATAGPDSSSSGKAPPPTRAVASIMRPPVSSASIRARDVSSSSVASSMASTGKVRRAAAGSR
jgi:class 3 adenylate cyclase